MLLWPLPILIHSRLLAALLLLVAPRIRARARVDHLHIAPRLTRARRECAPDHELLRRALLVRHPLFVHLLHLLGLINQKKEANRIGYISRMGI